MAAATLGALLLAACAAPETRRVTAAEPPTRDQASTADDATTHESEATAHEAEATAHETEATVHGGHASHERAADDHEDSRTASQVPPGAEKKQRPEPGPESVSTVQPPVEAPTTSAVTGSSPPSIARPPAAAETRPREAPPIQPAPTAPPPVSSRAPTTIEGSLRLRPGRGQSVGAADLEEAVVWFVPEGSHVVRPGSYTMNTRQKGFEPTVLAVPVGSRVSFPNSDPVLHNVYSDSVGQAFDLGLYGPGERPAHQFRQPGVVHVHCNVHRRMQAKIVVVESHLIARIGADGRFSIGDVPPGPGRLIAWHPRGERVERSIIAGEAWKVEVEVPLTRPRADAFAEGARR